MSDLHTPGPWRAEVLTFTSASDALRAHEESLADNGVRNFKVAYVFARESGGEDCTIACIGNGPKGVAHAHLIAAAPDLLAACVFALSEFECPYPLREEALAGLRAAIVKAKGDTPTT